MRGSGGRARQADPALANASRGENAELRRFRDACLQGDSRQARLALRNWLSEQDGRLASLQEFADSLGDHELASSLRELAGEGFTPRGEGGWNGRNTWKQFEAWRREARSAAAAGMPAMTDLYARENRPG